MPKIKNGLLALREFPEFLADLKMTAIARGSDTSANLVNLTVSVSSFSVARFMPIYQTVKYIQKIVQTSVQSSLNVLGDGNWKMGEGIQVGKSVKTDEADHPHIIEHFVRESFPFSSLSLS
jgi:exocyst complex component 7